jgi:photosystem II stability/assembly factor-like uncharacterized protein
MSSPRRFLPLFLVLVFILTTGQGCFVQFKKKKEVPVTFDGGFYKSLDGGETWAQSVDVLSIKGGMKINDVDVEDIVFDPQDNNAIYLLSKEKGAYYTLDQGKSWLPISILGTGVADIAIDPKDTCTIYAAVGNRVMKSDDCLRSFRELFHTDVTSKRITTLAVDTKNSRIIYAATASQLFKSTDGGAGWHIASTLGGFLKDIRIRNVSGTQVIYILTQTKFVHQSIDQGKTWTNFEEKLKRQRGAEAPLDLIFDESSANSLIYLTASGILRSPDGGQTWERVQTISSPSPIHSFAVYPLNKDLIYYTTNTTFYQSNDGGKNWQTKGLPTGQRVAKKIIFDKINPKIMYIMAARIPPPSEKK